MGKNQGPLTASVDQWCLPGQKPPSLSSSPSFTMTDRWFSGGFGLWEGAGECEGTPLSPFSGLDLGVVVRSGGAWGWGGGVKTQYVVSRDLHIKSGHWSGISFSLMTLCLWKLCFVDEDRKQELKRPGVLFLFLMCMLKDIMESVFWRTACYRNWCWSRFA